MIEPRETTAARIVDRGYQHYGGARLGSLHVVWAMTRSALAAGMGIRRPFYAKILPWALVLLVHVPVIVLLAVHVLNRESQTALPSYPELASGAFALLYLLFAAVVGPDMFCPDRRDRVLALYFTSPITRAHYVMARMGALALLLLALTLTPMLCLFVGNALLASVRCRIRPGQRADARDTCCSPACCWLAILCGPGSACRASPTAGSMPAAR